jgi:hypothetical protein
MNTIKVNFHNEQEEKVLISILESLNYDYEPEYTGEAKKAINESIDRAITDSKAGRVYSHEEVMAEARARYNL